MLDSLPVPGVSFLVQRRPGNAPNDLILIRADATPAELSDAVRTLATARSAAGDYPFERMTIRMRPHQHSQIARQAIPWTNGVLARLRNAKPKSLAGVGTVRAVAIWLPKQQSTGGALGIPRHP
ncbi:MAG: hypothetical protein ACJ796_07815 [Gemmatimonadaceae bacterium]